MGRKVLGLTLTYCLSAVDKRAAASRQPPLFFVHLHPRSRDTDSSDLERTRHKKLRRRAVGRDRKLAARG